MTSASAKITLTYPLYACDFDPQDPNRLIVGGGGGAGRSGVGNKITLLDTSSPEELKPTAEIELSRDEDNVTSLAAGYHRRGASTLVFAGVNSKPADQKKGNNEHFRVLRVNQRPSSSKSGDVAIAELVRTSLFTSNKEMDSYQRIIRLSAPFHGYPQAGAVATGLATQSQIAIFDISPNPGDGNTGPKLRGKLDIPKEANDLDLVQTSDEPAYQLVYCEDYEIHTMKIAKGSTMGPKKIYTTPHDDATGQPRPVFRAMRYLTPSFLIAAGNLPKRGGVVLQGYRLPAPGTEGEAPARLSISARLPRHVAQTTALAAANLHPPAAPGQRAGDTQFVVAVAGVDCSIVLYTLEHKTVGGLELLSQLYPFATLNGVHPHPISGLGFSSFRPPGQAAGAELVGLSPSKRGRSSAAAASSSAHAAAAAAGSAKGRPLQIKLASISVANTAVVHTIPLRKLPSPAGETTGRGKPRRAGPPRPRQPARHVVAAASKVPSPRALFVALAVAAALLAALLQGFLEVKGLTRTHVLGAAGLVPESWVVVRPEHKPLLVRLAEGGAAAATPFVLREGSGGGAMGGFEVAPHMVVAEDDGESSAAGGERERVEGQGAQAAPLQWEELPLAQKRAWKKKLKAAGHWGEEMGEAIFKGILFGELGGAVGDFVHG